MTDDDSTATDEGTDPDRDALADRLATLESAVEDLSERVSELEHAVSWMARQQAAETGNSVCPFCNTGGSLRVSRTPTGKKQVECANCGEKMN